MATSTTQMYPPLNGNKTISFNGRTYSSANGAAVTVPNFDVPTLSANGWSTTSPYSQTSGPTIAFLGDSITAINDNYGAFSNGVMTNTSGSAKTGPNSSYPLNRTFTAFGYGNWATVLTNQNVQMPDGYNWGAPGMGSDVILAVGVPYILSLNPLPNIVCVLVGTNDAFYSGVNPYQPNASTVALTATQTCSNLLSIYTQLIGAGIKVIACPVMPRNDSSSMTAAVNATHTWINEFIVKQTYSLNNFYVADARPTLVWPQGTTHVPYQGSLGQIVGIGYSGNSNASSGYQNSGYITVGGDNLHPSALGAYFQGKAIAAILNRLYPNNASYINLNNAVYVGQNSPNPNPFGNLLQNASFTATSPAPALTNVTLTGTCTIPSGWTLATDPYSTNVSLNTTTVQSANYPTQTLAQFTISGSYNRTATTSNNWSNLFSPCANSGNGYNLIRLYQSNPISVANGFSAGQYLEASLYIEMAAQTSLVGISAIGLQLHADNDSAQAYNYLYFSNGFGPYPQEAWSGVLRFRRPIVPAGTYNGTPYSGDQAGPATMRYSVYINMDGRGTSANAAETVGAVIKFGMPKLRVVF